MKRVLLKIELLLLANSDDQNYGKYGMGLRKLRLGQVFVNFLMGFLITIFSLKDFSYFEIY